MKHLYLKASLEVALRQSAKPSNMLTGDFFDSLRERWGVFAISFSMIFASIVAITLSKPPGNLIRIRIDIGTLRPKFYAEPMPIELPTVVLDRLRVALLENPQTIGNILNYSYEIEKGGPWSTSALVEVRDPATFESDANRVADEITGMHKKVWEKFNNAITARGELLKLEKRQTLDRIVQMLDKKQTAGAIEPLVLATAKFLTAENEVAAMQVDWALDPTFLKQSKSSITNSVRPLGRIRGFFSLLAGASVAALLAALIVQLANRFFSKKSMQ